MTLYQIYSYEPWESNIAVATTSDDLLDLINIASELQRSVEDDDETKFYIMAFVVGEKPIVVWEYL